MNGSSTGQGQVMLRLQRREKTRGEQQAWPQGCMASACCCAAAPRSMPHGPSCCRFCSCFAAAPWPHMLRLRSAHCCRQLQSLIAARLPPLAASLAARLPRRMRAAARIAASRWLGCVLHLARLPPQLHGTGCQLPDCHVLKRHDARKHASSAQCSRLPSPHQSNKDCH